MVLKTLTTSGVDFAIVETGQALYFFTKKEARNSLASFFM
jgi:hypothetical protein